MHDPYYEQPRTAERSYPPPPAYAPPAESKRAEVVVTDIQMPFWSMVNFMIKWAIAAIPAMAVLFVLALVALAFIKALLQQH